MRLLKLPETRRLAFSHYSEKEVGKVVETSGYRTEEEFSKITKGPKREPKKVSPNKFLVFQNIVI